MQSPQHYDVAIVGGGPAGSTVASVLKTYRPELSVLIVEKAKFPRDHIGESQLPSISHILDEIGAWEKIERANFPIKVGASYTWGHNNDRWDFDFVALEVYEALERPGRFEGQRRQTAFQVERSIYDDILLRHSEELGTEVREQTGVASVLVEDGDDGKRVAGLELDTGETVTARHYVDASGNVGLLRRALGVESEAPQELRNMAVWDYWENAEWAVEIGVGGTRVQVRSLPYGWMWFIPMGPTRTSIGLICPMDYVKKTGEKPADLYHKAMKEQEDIAKLTRNAVPRGRVETCRDWSHLADRVCGENWFICGEAAGFADPILAAGMALAHNSAKEVAYTILELERGELERGWLLGRYDERIRTNIRQHIQFAQYWYAANGCFTDLQDNCVAIAKEAGLKLEPKDAWRWLSQGGFTTESIEQAQFGSFDIASAKQVIELFDGRQNEVGWAVNKYNVLRLNLDGTKKGWIGQLKDGRIRRVLCYLRGPLKLPRTGVYLDLINMLQKTDSVAVLAQGIFQKTGSLPPRSRDLAMTTYMQTLDVMIEQGWVVGKLDPKQPRVQMSNTGNQHHRMTTETERSLAASGNAGIFKDNMPARAQAESPSAEPM